MNEPTTLRWARQLREAREAEDESQTSLAAKTGLAQQTISLAERGVGSIDTFERLARHFGLTLEAGLRVDVGSGTDRSGLMDAAECSQCGGLVGVWHDRLIDHAFTVPARRCAGSGWLVATHDWYRREQENG